LYGIGSSAGEITADHARSTALRLEDRFIQQCPFAVIVLPVWFRLRRLRTLPHGTISLGIGFKSTPVSQLNSNSHSDN
jgi:hypothetical protein